MQKAQQRRYKTVGTVADLNKKVFNPLRRELNESVGSLRAGDRDRGVISTFSSGGGKICYIFFNATGLLKNLKKQHFICSNFTLFIVPFLSFFLFFSFFLFSFFFGGTPLQPSSNDAPGQKISNTRACHRVSPLAKYVTVRVLEVRCHAKSQPKTIET